MIDINKESLLKDGYDYEEITANYVKEKSCGGGCCKGNTGCDGCSSKKSCCKGSSK